MTDEITVYEIPSQNLAGLMAKIEKISKKSIKINGKPVILNILEDIRKPRFKVTLEGRKIPVTDINGNPTFDLFHKVSVTCEPVKIEGWTFITTIDHQSGGNILRSVPNIGVEIPEKYRTVGPLCDHCNKIRGRRDTYLLRCDADGAFKQIGKQCVRDFIGYPVEQFLAMAQCYSEAVPSDSDSDYDGGGGNRSYIPVKAYLAHVSACIRAYGWCSRKESSNRDDATPTSFAAFTNMFTKRSPSFTPVELIEQDFLTANDALEWAKAINPRSDFDHNMQVLANVQTIEHRNSGIVAYFIPAMLKAKEIEFEKIARKASLGLSESQHVGAIGDKLKNISAVLYGYKPIEGAYGTTYIYKFRGDDGNVYTWFSSQGVEGLGSYAATHRQPVILNGTVKSHDEYEGVKNTKLTRCKVLIVEDTTEQQIAA